MWKMFTVKISLHVNKRRVKVQCFSVKISVFVSVSERETCEWRWEWKTNSITPGGCKDILLPTNDLIFLTKKNMFESLSFVFFFLRHSSFTFTVLKIINNLNICCAFHWTQGCFTRNKQRQTRRQTKKRNQRLR